MAELDFTELNATRAFTLSHGDSDKESKQIDSYIAADDEVVITIECKWTATVQSSTFKNEIEE